MLELGITFDYAQMVMDNEMAKMIKKVVNGISVSDETLAVDIVKKVGYDGNFLTEDHTYNNMRTQSRCKVIDRRMRGAWLEDGAKSFTDRAYEEALSILQNYHPVHLSASIQAELRAIVEETEREYGILKS